MIIHIRPAIWATAGLAAVVFTAGSDALRSAPAQTTQAPLPAATRPPQGVITIYKDPAGSTTTPCRASVWPAEIHQSRGAAVAWDVDNQCADDVDAEVRFESATDPAPGAKRSPKAKAKAMARTPARNVTGANGRYKYGVYVSIGTGAQVKVVDPELIVP